VTIRARLTIGYGAAFALTLLVIGVLVWTQFERRSRSSLEEALQVHAQDVAANLAEGGTSAVEAVDPTLPGIFTAILGPNGSIVDAGPGTPTGIDAVAPGSSTGQLTADGPEFAWYAQPMANGQTILVGTSLAEAQRSANHLSELLLVFGAAGVALSFAGGWLLAGRALAPVDRLRREAQAIGSHELDRRLAVEHAHDEIGQLALTLNALLARVEGSVERERAFIAGIAHDLRTPVAALRMRLELAARSASDDDALTPVIRSAHQDSVRLSDLADGLLRLAEAQADSQPETAERVHLAEIVADAERDVAWIADERDVRVTCDAEDAEVLIGRVRVHQALLNLLLNAVRYGPAHAPVDVAIERSREEVPGGQEVPAIRVEVSDRGPGVSPASIDQLFEPFAHGDGSASPHGLGLATAAAAVRALGGSIGYRQRQDGGATFWFWVPQGT
jgi:two-component system OmpR family sensor kinase